MEGKDKIEKFERYQKIEIKKLIDEFKNNKIDISTLSDLQLDILISYYSCQVKKNKEKIKNIKEVVYKNE